MWDRYLNNGWDDTLRNLVAKAKSEAGGVITLEEEDRLTNDFCGKEQKRYKGMTPEEQEEVFQLHKRHCYGS